MPSVLKPYSFADFGCAITGPGGAFTLGSDAGAAEEGVSIEMLHDADDMIIGAGGDAMHSLNPTKAGRVTVRLLKTSPVNALLSALYNFQHTGSATWGQNTLTMTDLQRGDVYVCQGGAFLRFPANAYALKGNTIEWQFLFATIDPLLGAGIPDVNVAA